MLSWSEIRARAARFAEDWADARYEKGETQSFYNDFFSVFGVQRRKVASFEEPVKKLGGKHGFIDLFWKGTLLVEHKSAGRSLTKAKEQAFDYFPGIKDAELPRYLLVSDFQTFELHDLDEATAAPFRLVDLHANVERFGFILGVERRVFKDQDPVNIQASELMGRLHDALLASRYAGHDLERLLVRLVFCLFADDTGIFARDSFLDLVRERSEADGRGAGRLINELFDVLNTPEDRRQKALDDDLARFPYINGDLFAERLPAPAFDFTMRELLIEACEFNWSAVSPAIFGSLFQSVMNKKERRASGAHYTTEKNILKVIEPLFLDDLRAEFARLKARRDTGRPNALRAFQDKLAGLNFLDPACGCGNFLIIAYRELRALEIEILREIFPRKDRVLDVAALSKIDVSQFYGIEIGEFAARIAEVALWMMDHIMNNRLSLEFGEVFARIPLKTSPHIVHGDALEIEWAEVLAPEKCAYVMGNPPFIGKHLMSAPQQIAFDRLLGKSGGSGLLDFVAAWFVKAGAYIQTGAARIGFVATNSATQGEQVAHLWPILFDRYHLEIAFAHRTFAWGSDARGKAHVHVVILGLTRQDAQPEWKRLFSYADANAEPAESAHLALSPYLIDAKELHDRHMVIRSRRSPLSEVPPMIYGSKPVDDGALIFTQAEKQEFFRAQPDARKYLRRLVSAHEFLNGEERWCLWLKDVEPALLRKMPLVMERVERVKRFRQASKKAPTRDAANVSWEFAEIRQPMQNYVVIPRHSSETRTYVPFGFFDAMSIVHDSCACVPAATLHDFGIMTSAMHMHWMRMTCGRIKSDFRYSSTLVYNTFPWPDGAPAAKTRVAALAQAVLDARAAFPNSTLADLYDPDTMPPVLRKAHGALDSAVDRLYRAKPFDSDRERVEHLFGLYERLVAPLTALAGAKPKRRKRGG